MFVRTRIAAVTAALIFAAAPLAGLAQETPAADSAAAVTAKSLWRCYFVWGDELVRWQDGAVSVFATTKTGIERAEGAGALTAAPPADWAAPDFDDVAWVAAPGPIRHGYFRRDLAGLYLRGRFVIDDPAKAGDLPLELAFRGGAAVYVNGVEVARGHLPAGKLAPDALAEPYPKEAYVDAEGVLLAKPGDVRIRTLTAKIPASALRKGINVLAIEFRRAVTDELLYTAKHPVDARKKPIDKPWSMLGFEALSVGGPVAPDVPAAGVLEVWPTSPLVDVYDREAGEVRPAPAPLNVVAARNGRFTGVVAVRSAAAIKGLKVTPTDLVSAAGGKIPASAVQVRTALPGMKAPDGALDREAKGAQFLGLLAEAAPSEIALPAGSPTVAVGVWLTVAVPADAAAGDYAGKVTIAADGAAAVEVPVTLTVKAFTLPDPQNFVSCVNPIESPESVALQYGVAPFSDAHFKLLDKTFALLADVGPKSIYIPLIAQTNMGNAYTMVRRIKGADGKETLDFTPAERYLDLAIKHFGKIPVVAFYVWTPTMGGGGFGALINKPKNDFPLKYTVLDAASGEMTTAEGPDWGDEGIVAFWQPVFEGLRKRLADRGLDGAMALCMGSDRVPSKEAIAALAKAAPEARWVIHAHGRYTQFAGKPLAEDASVWGVKGPFLSTDRRYMPGWENKVLSTIFPRYGAGSMGHVRDASPLGVYHAVVECYQASGYNGLGRMGADFWPVVKGRRGMTAVLWRYPSWQRPGAPSMANGELLFPDAAGPGATVRFEALRLGSQECEARIFVEMAIRDKAKRAKLGEALAGRAQKLLDERVEQIMRAKRDYHGAYSIATDASWLGYAQEQPARAAALFDLAAEVAKALGQ